MTKNLRAILLACRFKFRAAADNAVTACRAFLLNVGVGIGWFLNLITTPRLIGLITLAFTLAIVWLSWQSNKLAASSAKDAAASALSAAESARDTDASLRLEMAPAFSLTCVPGWTDGAQFDVTLDPGEGETSTMGPFGAYRPANTYNWVSCDFHNLGRLSALQIAGAIHFNYVKSLNTGQPFWGKRIRKFWLTGVSANSSGVIRFCNPSRYTLTAVIQQGISFVQPPFNRKSYVQMQTDVSDLITVPSLLHSLTKPVFIGPDNDFILGACTTE